MKLPGVSITIAAMRKVLRLGLVVLTIAVTSTAVRADDLIASVAARRLAEVLLHSKPERVPAGLSSPSVTPMSSGGNDAAAGIVAEVRMSFPGRNSNAEIRYAVFANPDDARKYSMNFSSDLTASHQRRIFFPFFTDADCVQRGENQLCALQNGNVFALVMSNGVASANTHEHQTARGVSAGIVAQFALAHLQTVRKSIEQTSANALPGAAPVMPFSGSDPCALLSEAEAAAVLGSPVTPARRSGGVLCQYNSRASASDSVAIQLIAGGRAKFDFDRDRLVAARQLDGVGDAAFEFVSLAGFAQVYVLSHERYFAITLNKQRDRSLRDSAANLARKIAGGLSH
jgi:hypothetical protein